ncbi:hypothetical protein RclHR1_06370014 [Rhizophagus clarus]|uniref:Integrase catalytic domain-containing protein n=1 Tax=Rhizophagus clarus TaxID=94130 RepID=A0A2Z6SI88_9GLOM|nr:hypothetical protein RclHR1_06370014 [Rhizophagus clarus]
MSAQLPLLPIISIDSGEARNLDISIALKKIYYQPIGYHRNAKKLYEASIKTGYDFTIDEVGVWFEKQAVHQIHKPHPKYIPRASFCSVTTSNEVHQMDVLYMPYDKVGQITYLFCLNIVDVASRYKASIPIGAYSVKNRQGILTSATITQSLEKIYDDPECPLIWPKLLITDKGLEFKGDFEKLFPFQDASDLLTLDRRSRAWVKNLPIVVEDINNSIIRQLGISPVDAIKEKEVFAKPSYLRDGPIDFDKEKLFSDVLPVLYWLKEIPFRLTDDDDYVIKHPERSFVREELMVIFFNTELPPQWVLTN